MYRVILYCVCDNSCQQGHFGQVFKGMYRGRPCAIKRLKERCSDNIEQDKELEKEFEIMSQLKHVSIVEVFGRCLPIREEGQAGLFKTVDESAIYNSVSVNFCCLCYNSS